jgi:clan AA aspartic protease (TIGR02281 family)
VVVARALVAVALVLAAPAARADIYTWTDAQGQVHYTQDLQSVPPEHRGEARDRASQAPTAPSRVQTYSNGAASVAPAAPMHHAFAGPSPGGGPRVHRIPVERAGNGMVVPVRINGRVVAPFLIDTGASYVLVPKAVADEAGIQVGADTRKMQFTTANGIVENALVTLDSVELGTAMVEDVPASISPSLQIGLLGLSFFNHFTYQVDAANGVLTLTENGLVESGDLRGGRSETQWRNEYAGLHRKIEAIQARRETVPSSHGRQLAELDDLEKATEGELEQLDSEADQAHVPDAWRR